MFKPCTDFKVFSHCQLLYLFQYDAKTKTCHGYTREKCNSFFFCFSQLDIHANFTGVTLTMSLSTDRMDRLPFHLYRWHEPMSIVIQLYEDELSTIASIISGIQRPNIRFTLYILKNVPRGRKGFSFITMNNKVIYYKSCFAYNELRDLAIETIQTTHYLMIDGDAIITSMNGL